MQKEITHEQLLEILRGRTKNGTLTRLASELGISISFMGEVVRGEKPISGKVAAALGYDRLIIFRKAS